MVAAPRPSGAATLEAMNNSPATSAPPHGSPRHDAARAQFDPSSNVSQLRESATIAASARARALRAAGRPIIDLGVGEPDSETPAFIRAAAARAVEQGATRYTATEGILPLREAVAAQASTLAGRAVAPATVVVSSGSKQSLFNACFVLFGDGDEVLIPTPGWTSYYEMVALSRARPVPVAGDRENSLKVSADALQRAATPRTRGVILNSPCNPTGAVYDECELRDIALVAARNGWWVISDEIYDRIVYDGPAASLLPHVSPDRLVLVNGVAKSFAMTGWRIGWCIAPVDVARAMTALQSHTTSNAAAVSQHAALAALTQTAQAADAVGAMVARLRERRDAAMTLLRRAPLPCVTPAGAFYLFIDVRAAARDSATAGDVVATRLLEEHDLAVVPGSAFLAPDYIRASYAAPIEQVLEGVRRIVGLCD